MKKISLILLLFVFCTCKCIAYPRMDFAKELIHRYPDGTEIYRILGGDKYGYKVVILKNRDNTYTVGAVKDSDNAITVDKIKASTDARWPYYEDMIFGQTLHNTGRWKNSIFYGYKDGDCLATPSLVLTGKEWTITNDYEESLTLGPNGEGSYTDNFVENGFASQARSGYTRGSNRYYRQHKTYNATGGITGGYSFTLKTKATYKIKWYIKDNRFYVELLPNPKISPISVTTSMDDDNSVKTPTLKAKQWVRIDIKYNYEVNQAKEQFFAKLNNVRYPLVDEKIRSYSEGVIVLGDNPTTYVIEKGTGAATPYNMMGEEIVQLYEESYEWLKYQLSE